MKRGGYRVPLSSLGLHGAGCSGCAECAECDECAGEEVDGWWRRGGGEWRALGLVDLHCLRKSENWS